MGHILNPKGISVDPERTAAIMGVSASKDVPQLLSFLGIVNHLTNCVPNIADETKPLQYETFLVATQVGSRTRDRRKCFVQ